MFASLQFRYSKGRRVDGSAVHAVIVIGSDVVLESAYANYHRVDGEPVHPTRHAAA